MPGGTQRQPPARICEIVGRSRQLKPNYGAAAWRIGTMAAALVDKHDRDWLDTGRGADAYRLTCSGSERYPNRTLPHNQ